MDDYWNENDREAPNAEEQVTGLSVRGEIERC